MKLNALDLATIVHSTLQECTGAHDLAVMRIVENLRDKGYLGMGKLLGEEDQILTDENDPSLYYALYLRMHDWTEAQCRSSLVLAERHVKEAAADAGLVSYFVRYSPFFPDDDHPDQKQVLGVQGPFLRVDMLLPQISTEANFRLFRI